MKTQDYWVVSRKLTWLWRAFWVKSIAKNVRSSIVSQNLILSNDLKDFHGIFKNARTLNFVVVVVNFIVMFCCFFGSNDAGYYYWDFVFAWEIPKITPDYMLWCFFNRKLSCRWRGNTWWICEEVCTTTCAGIFHENNLIFWV